MLPLDIITYTIRYTCKHKQICKSFIFSTQDNDIPASLQSTNETVYDTQPQPAAERCTPDKVAFDTQLTPAFICLHMWTFMLLMVRQMIISKDNLLWYYFV